MKCGDRGHRKADGTPCQQTIGVKAAGCIWHTSSPEGRAAFAMKGGLASRMRRALPASTPEPPFDTVENIIAWAQQMARAALVEEVDTRRLAEARGFAQLALSALSARTQQELVDALLKLEHGGAAMLLLSRLTNGLNEGRTRPLPGRTLTVVPRPIRTATEHDRRQGANAGRG
jgi:hypothetical protein